MHAVFDAVSSVAWLVYLLTFVFLFLETAGLPLPALSFALLAATLAGNGSLSFPAVVLATILGATIGGPVGHSLGRKQGRPLLDKVGSRVKITPDRLDATQVQFEKRGKAIVFSRFFVPILPWSAGIFAGIVKMPGRTLFLFNFLAITAWSLLELTFVAYFSSQVKDLVSELSISCIFWIITGILGTFFLIRTFARRRKAKKAPAPGELVIEVRSDTSPSPVAAKAEPPVATGATVTATASTELASASPTQDMTTASGEAIGSTGNTPRA